jgi:hypothetical protein
LYFWYILITSTACGVGILIHQAFSEKKSRWWVAGVFAVIVTNLIIILMPIFRGYCVSDLSDEVIHLGLIKDIALTDHLGKNNVYPISHILSYIFLSICELDFRLVIKIIPSIFYLIYMMGLYLLSTEICTKFEQALLVMAFSSVLLFTYFNYLFLPTQFFLYIIPFLLFIFFRKTRSIEPSYSLIFIILLIMMPFLHPLGSVFLIAIFMLLALLNPLLQYLAKINNNPEGEVAFYSPKVALIPGLIVFTIFFMWFCNFAVFSHTFSQASEWFIKGYGTTAVTTLTENYQTAGLTISKTVDLIIRTYGHNLIFSFLSLVAIYIISKKVFIQRNSLTIKEIFFPLLFPAFCAFYISTLVGNFLGTGSSQRIFCWALMASTVINGMIYYEWLSKHRGMTIAIYAALLEITIIFAASLGMFSIYPSPYIMQANLQVTMMDWTGMQWFSNSKNNDVTIYFDQLPINFQDFLYGFSTTKPKSVGSFNQVPPNIGYNKQNHLADSIDSDSYLVISERIREYKKQLWPEKGRFTLNDLNRISFDPGVSKIYSDRGLDIYHVLALMNETRR